jgi:small subunit ribosomal protein S8
MQDPVADMLTRIRNAQQVGKVSVSMPASLLKAAIAKVLLEEGYILAFNLEEQENNKSVLQISLKYHKGKPVIEKIDRASKPGLRIYRACDDLPEVMNGLGISIVSTSSGVMTGRAAKKIGQGGEVLCYVA